MQGHAQRPDTRPIEDPADESKFTLVKKGSMVWTPLPSGGVSWKCKQEGACH